jgi:HK97 family phage prohead protease
MQLQYKSLDFKAGGADGLAANEFHGYGSTFRNWDEDGDIIQKGAFELTLPEFLVSGLILYQHQMRVPIGKPTVAREDEKGLYLKARISDTSDGRDCLTLMRDGVITKLSIGYRVEAYTMLSKEQGIALLGESDYQAAMASLPWWSDGLRLITQIKLYEISPVSVPANGQADILGVKSAGGRIPETEREFEAMLRDAGFPRKAAVALTGHGWKGLQRDAGADVDPALLASLKSLQSAISAS